MNLVIRFAKAQEAREDVPRLAKLRLWAAFRWRRPRRDEIRREIKARWPELAPHRQRWLEENL